jgi:transcription elongation factor GreB
MKQSNYITRAGWDKLETELRWLWKEERPRITQAVADAAALGDRSENAEYIYGKKGLREIDRRVRFLTKRLDQLQVVYPSPEQAGRVFFGARVALMDEQEQMNTYQLVGSDEFDLRSDKISIDSPMARALLGKQVDDEVLVNTPSGQKEYLICDIQYSSEEEK